MDVKFGNNAGGGAYEYESVGRPLIYTNAQLDALYKAGDINGLGAAVTYLNAWFDDAGAWYGDAIGRSSGGKQGRRMAEAAMIRDYEKPMVPKATAYINGILNQADANRISALPGFVTSLPGAQVPNASYRNVDTVQPATTSLLLPIGAAIAAFLYLKGH